MLREIEVLNSNDDAALWAQQRLDAKNTLSAADAERVEQAFQARLLKFLTAPGGESVPDEPERTVRGRGQSKQRRRAPVVDMIDVSVRTRSSVKKATFTDSTSMTPTTRSRTISGTATSERMPGWEGM